MTFIDCTADLVGQLNGNGQKRMLQIDAPPVENFWLRHCSYPSHSIDARTTGKQNRSHRYKDTCKMAAGK